MRNQKKQKWPEAEANRLYLLASQAVEREFKLTRPVRPRFTLVLGFEGNQLDVNTGELRMAKWDRRIFADGVILFCMEQMLTPDTRLQLLRRTLLAAESVVDVDDKVARSEHMETPAVCTPPAPRTLITNRSHKFARHAAIAALASTRGGTYIEASSTRGECNGSSAIFQRP